MHNRARTEIFKYVLVVLLLAGAVFSVYYYHGVLHKETFFTHLFYVPIVLAAMWWRKKGIAVAAFLAVFLLCSDFFFWKMPSVTRATDLLRALMFMVVALIVAFLSERVHREKEEVTKGKARWDDSFKDVGEGMFLIDDEFTILQANNAFAELLGRNPQDLVGEKCCQLVHGLENPPETCLTCAAIKEHRSVDTEYYEPFLGKHLASLADSSFDDDGNFKFAVHIIRDISERKWAEELDRMNAELKGYAHAVSHDLKGPISSAAIAFDMLRNMLDKGGVPEEKAEELKEIIAIGQSNMSNANDLVENLLFLAETGAPKGVCSVSIEDTINDVLADSIERIEEKVITVELGPALGKVVASPTQMYQLFSNLIRNSIEHNKSENPLIEISSPGVEGAVHRFLVRDNGPGIPEEILDEVFTPFVRAQSSGTGIGLSIVEKVVKTCGGEIRAYNDNGACFEFTLKDFEK